MNARVDAGVAELVEALSADPSVMTLDSCQGDRGRRAYVLLTTDGDLDALAATLAAALDRIAEVTVHGSPGDPHRMVELRLEPAAVAAAVARLRRDRLVAVPA